MHNINKWLLVPYLLWMVIFIIIPVILLVYFSFIDIHGHFSFTNYEQVFSTRYLKMFIDILNSIFKIKANNSLTFQGHVINKL